jgi:hypothetical protein
MIMGETAFIVACPLTKLDLRQPIEKVLRIDFRKGRLTLGEPTDEREPD